MRQSPRQTPSSTARVNDAEHDSLEVRLRDSEARYDRASKELERLRKAVSRQGGSASSAELRRLRKELDAIKGSTIWRIAGPVRLALNVVKRPGAALRRFRLLYLLVSQSAANIGWRATLGKVAYKLSQRLGIGLTQSGRAGPNQALVLGRLESGDQTRLAMRVLLIAETSLPQCFKYRVAQKQRMIQHLGYECTVLSWRDTHECMQAIQSHAVVIFYRTPAFDDVMRMIREAKELSVPTFWEVDDLIFDADKYATNANLKDLSQAEMRHLLSDAVNYRKAMLECDYCVASTQALANEMIAAGARRAYVIENALDQDTLRIADIARRKGRVGDDLIRIVYGSGTRTHDTDFRLISDAILDVLRRYEHVRFRVIGQLNLPPEFEQFSSQLERFPLSDYATYLSTLAECDINIAPLEDSIFSDAKSNIKFLEGAVVGLPSVCSPRSAFRQAIVNGQTGYLADGVEEWRAAFEQLLESKALRDAIGTNAYVKATTDYGYKAIASAQILPILQVRERKDTKLRVLAVNIFFEPRSFGGATVVAEEMAKALNAGENVEYYAFTSLPTSKVDAYQLVRYDAKGAVVFAMGLPEEHDKSLEYDNPYAVASFMEAVRALRPNVVHLHSIQGIGAAIADACQAEGIPYVVTLHDAWWICARQFMITPANRYCFQRSIDLDVCAALCVSKTENEPRQTRLHEILENADLVLSPSAFFRDLYVDNGFDPSRIVVNKNGVRMPARPRLARAAGEKRLRFGYVGGDSHIKGAHLLKKFFATTPFTNYELVVVDNTLNLGMRSINARLWACTGTLTIAPAYTQDTIDEFFDGIDVLLFPTQWKESFGLTVREALIRDVWVVATDAGGVVEDIVDGENGNIIPFEDDGDALRVALTRLLDDPNLLLNHKNPYKEKIRTVEEQAVELHSYLGRLVS